MEGKGHLSNLDSPVHCYRIFFTSATGHSLLLSVVNESSVSAVFDSYDTISHPSDRNKNKAQMLHISAIGRNLIEGTYSGLRKTLLVNSCGPDISAVFRAVCERRVVFDGDCCPF